MMMMITAAALVLIHSVNSFALKEKKKEIKKRLQCCLAQGKRVGELESGSERE